MAQGHRASAGGGPRISESGKFEGAFKAQTAAPFIKERLSVWERMYSRCQEELSSKASKSIKITLPDGKEKEGQSFRTTPLEIAQGISKGLADSCVAARVLYCEAVESLKQCVAADGDSDDEQPADQPAAAGEVQAAVLWDLTRPLEGSCRLELLKFEDAQGQEVFWHSSAHILGQAMERSFGCHLTIGPALETGFYYDGFFGDKKLGKEDFAVIEKSAAEICKEQQPFQRCVLSKAEALELFADNPFKVQLISNKVPDGSMTSCYRCGDLIDLCRGPHIPHTGKAKAFMVTRNSAAYWLGDQSLDSLQRIYGITFPSEKQMKEYQKFLEEAAKRDHRNVGKQQELFMLHPWASPGSTFWFPMGARVYNKLMDFMRSEYRLRGFSEVVTPNMYSAQLFKTSGHYQKYREDMYNLNVEGQDWFLKPMNCPGHFLMFDSRIRSYKELPIRYADFGTLHRNEDSGALSGLTRVRRFQQDDGHIFVRPEQIKQEVLAALDFLKYVYGVFGFSASYALSTKPKKALGSDEIWNNAEAQLKQALNESGLPWSLNPGDGAFYGPKIDIRLTDAMKRRFQCGTIQLDFNNPIRFNLQYRKEGVDEVAEEEAGEPFEGAVEKDEKGEIIWREGKLRSGFERPVVIHRAVLGSIERMSAILIEHYAGKFPFWLSPRQVMVVPVSDKFSDYAEWVARQLMLHGYHSETDLSNKTLNKKVRESQMAQWNFTTIVGDSEKEALSVNVRERGVEKPLGVFSMPEFIKKLEGLGMPTSEPFNTFEPFEGRVVAQPMAQVAPAAPAASPDAKAAAPGGKGKGGKGAKADDHESFLAEHPYIGGFAPSKADAEHFAKVSEQGLPETENLKRWYQHLCSFTEVERKSWQ